VRLIAAVEPDQIKMGAIAALVVLVLLVFLVMRFIQKLVLKLIVIAALVGAGVFVYSQRESLDECQQKVRDSLGRDCTCEFAGYEVTVPGCAALVPQPGE
jgi:hypothetical protein